VPFTLRLSIYNLRNKTGRDHTRGISADGRIILKINSYGSGYRLLVQGSFEDSNGPLGFVRGGTFDE
jgi:hypothetical protein